MKILYVEDDPEAREFVQKALARSGLATDVATDAASGFDRATQNTYDLCILDIALPDESGLALLRRLRGAGVETPVLFLTAQAEVSHRVEGLNLGADDFLSKPFAFAELLARVRAIARRSTGRPSVSCVEVADLVLDIPRHRVERAGTAIDLTPKEFALLEYLLENAGHTVSRTMIVERVWGLGFGSHDNVIDVHINRLRNKVDRGFSPKLIHTIKGVGYRVADPGTESPEPGAR